MKSSTTENPNALARGSSGACLAIALGLFELSGLAAGVNPTPRVVPPNSTAYGKTYSQWSVAWYQWAFSLR